MPIALPTKICAALGIANPEQFGSGDGSTRSCTLGHIEGTLEHLAFASGYTGRVPIKPDDLMPILRHVMDMYMRSLTKGTNKGGLVLEALSMLEGEAKADNLKLDTPVWVEICGMLRKIASGWHYDRQCESLLDGMTYERQHLQAFFCLACVVIHRLRGETPPEILETLTDAARVCCLEGHELRIVLGYALLGGLKQAVPDWYDRNEPLLFGRYSPKDNVLMRVCLLWYRDAAHPILDAPTMEKYHRLVLDALRDEMNDIREIPEGERRAEPSAPIRHFMRHVLNGSRRYGVGRSAKDLARIGPDAVSMAGSECRRLIVRGGTGGKTVDRAVRFWKAVLDSSPEPAALYGFGWGDSTGAIGKTTWERLMLRTCEAAGGRVENPYLVLKRAASGGNPTETGAKIVKLILRGKRHFLYNPVVRPILDTMRENGSLDDADLAVIRG